MNQIKKNICIIFAFLSILCMVTLPATAEETLPFEDVITDKWYYQSISYVYNAKIMTGTSKTRFSPNMTATRGMMTTMIYSMEGKPAVSGNSFVDVEPSRYYAKAVNWASQNGIVAGYGHGRFGPNDNITREQFVSILYKYVQYKGINFNGSGSIEEFKDISKISAYAIESMKWAVGNQLISGMPGKLLEPKSFASRAQIATIMMKLDENILIKSGDGSDDNKDDGDDSGTDKRDSDGSEITDFFEVVFKDNDGNILKKETVRKNMNATPPEPPERPGFVFDGWTGNYQNVTKNEIVVASYKELSGENIFAIDSANLKKGETATVYVKLTGKVNLVDFDITLSYDRNVLEVVGLDYRNGIADIANDLNGTILVNYSGTQNLVEEVTVLAIHVRVKEATKKIKTEITFKEVKFVDYLNDNNQLVPAPYDVIPGVITIQ